MYMSKAYGVSHDLDGGSNLHAASQGRHLRLRENGRTRKVWVKMDMSAWQLCSPEAGQQRPYSTPSAVIVCFVLSDYGGL